MKIVEEKSKVASLLFLFSMFLLSFLDGAGFVVFYGA